MTLNFLSFLLHITHLRLYACATMPLHFKRSLDRTPDSVPSSPAFYIQSQRSYIFCICPSTWSGLGCCWVGIKPRALSRPNKCLIAEARDPQPWPLVHLTGGPTRFKMTCEQPPWQLFAFAPATSSGSPVKYIPADQHTQDQLETPPSLPALPLLLTIVLNTLLHFSLITVY